MADEKIIDHLREEEQETSTQPEEPATHQQPPQESENPLQKELEKLKADYDALNDRYLRMLAEYDNYRKRTARERENIYPEAEAGILTRLLPFVDDLERATSCECSDPEYKKGMDMIMNTLKTLFNNLGVEEVGAPGDSFDPNLHHAVMHVEDETLGENVIVEILQKGYRRGDKILRCAMVKTAN